MACSAGGGPYPLLAAADSQSLNTQGMLQVGLIN